MARAKPASSAAVSPFILRAVRNAAMTGASTFAIETAVPVYDFTDRRLIVDVGGGHGALLGAVLAAAIPTTRL